MRLLQAYGTRSVAHYVPHGHTEYGTLLCTASNRIGQMKHPCIFHVVQAGKLLKTPLSLLPKNLA